MFISEAEFPLFLGEAGIPKCCPVSAVPLFSPRGIPRWYPEKRGKIKQSHCSFGYLVLCPQIAPQNSNLLLFSKLVTVSLRIKGRRLWYIRILDPDTDWKDVWCLPSEAKMAEWGTSFSITSHWSSLHGGSDKFQAITSGATAQVGKGGESLERGGWFSSTRKQVLPFPHLLPL